MERQKKRPRSPKAGRHPEGPAHLSRPSPSECEVKPELPFWYRGDGSEARRLPSDPDPVRSYEGGTIYDLYLTRTLPSTAKSDLIAKMNMDTEGIVPGYALRQKEYDPQRNEHLPVPRDEFLDKLRQRIKQKTPCEYPHNRKKAKPSICFDGTVDCESHRQADKEETYEEWLRKHEAPPGSRKGDFKDKIPMQWTDDFAGETVNETGQKCPWQHKFKHSVHVGCMKIHYDKNKEFVVPVSLHSNLNGPPRGFLQDYLPKPKRLEAWWKGPLSCPKAFRTSLHDTKAPFWNYKWL